MAEIKKYNDLSPKLRSFLPKLKPREKIRFQLDGLYIDKITKMLVCPTSFVIVPTDRIFDPWAGAKTGKDEKGQATFEGAYIDIAYILREVPAPADSPKDSVIEFGKIMFTRTLAGVIEIIGGQMQMEKLLIVLFFNNRNSTNVGKPWFVKPNSKGVFHEVQAVKQATDKLGVELRKDKAKNAITAMSEAEVNTAIAGLKPNQYRSLSPDQRRLALRAIASNTPDKILDMSSDVEIQSTAFIEELLIEDIIQIDQRQNAFVWPDDKTKICTIKAGSTPHNSLKRYFQTDEGHEVLVSLEKQLQEAKSSKKEKTSIAVV